MAKARNTTFYVRCFDEQGNLLATSIQVIVPAGLNRFQAFHYCAGIVGAEMARYAAAECLGLTLYEPGMDLNEIVT